MIEFDNMKCRLCESNTKPVFKKTLLNRHNVEYRHCGHCDLLQTEKPYWLEEAYSESIAALDVGAIHRTLTTAGLVRFLTQLIGRNHFNCCLDYGGGPGTFTRLLRDYGLPFKWYDKYCPNIYAKGFESSLNVQNDLITCFEVFEHFDNVAEEIETLFLSKPKFLLVGTSLRWNLSPDWWYYVVETGQHIAFYSLSTMQWIGKKYGYRVYSTASYSLFVSQEAQLNSVISILIPFILNRSVLACHLSGWLDRLFPVRSLQEFDFEYLKKPLLNNINEIK